jgi:GT2 family glycosyltransferase
MKKINDIQHPRIAVVTPIFNDLDHTLSFLTSLRRQVFKDFATIIVDMGNDNAREAVKKVCPEAIVLRDGDVVLWSGGSNAGVKYAIENNYEYVYTVNNDVELDKNCLQKVVEFADAHPKSLVGSMISYESDLNQVWYFGGYISCIGNLPHAEGSLQDFNMPMQPEWLTGMGTLVPVQAYKDVGLYDEKHFPHYMADADFSLRAKRDGGYDLWVIPDARLVFDETSSWFGNCRRQPELRHIYDLLFDIKSPMNLKSRYAFHKKHLKLFRLKFVIYNIRYIPRLFLSFISSYLVFTFKHHFK